MKRGYGNDFLKLAIGSMVAGFIISFIFGTTVRLIIHGINWALNNNDYREKHRERGMPWFLKS